MLTACEQWFNLREGILAKLEMCPVLWARQFEVGATERVRVHLDFVDGFSTIDHSDEALGLCFA